jgi:hypothetical protein
MRRDYVTDSGFIAKPIYDQVQIDHTPFEGPGAVRQEKILL